MEKKEQGKYEDLKGVKILLVEDNKFNQLLATRVLDKMGCEVEIAENGREALEKLKEVRYDIVLMDIQMPEMDGYEATRRIRMQLEGKVNKIPIMAMTAHALEDEGSKCILAGMNDYISKPFEQDILFTKIINLITGNKTAFPELVEIESPQEVDDTPDLAYLEEVLGNSNEALLEVLNTLHQEMPVQTENLKKSLRAKNWKQLSQDAHKMRSCIIMIGMPHFLSMIETIEKNAAEEIKFDDLTILTEQVVSISYVTISKIKAELEKLQSATRVSTSSTTC